MDLSVEQPGIGIARSETLSVVDGGGFDPICRSEGKKWGDKGMEFRESRYGQSKARDRERRSWRVCGGYWSVVGATPMGKQEKSAGVPNPASEFGDSEQRKVR